MKKVYVAVIFDQKTKEPTRIEIFKNKQDAEDFLIANHSFNMPIEKIIR